MIARRQFLTGIPAGLALASQAPARIRQIDIFHHSHLDVGFTDLPSVCRDMQVRFLDAALEACFRHRGFHWTVEATMVLDDWWKAAPPARREQLLAAVRRGQMDVTALAFNQTPFLSREQWRKIVEWLPPALWKQVEPRSAMQNDVNGMPRAGALLLLDLGVRHLAMGINADSGGPPFRRPSAFWWRMPDGRKMFVWLGEHYGTAYSYFEPNSWIRGQPKGADVALRPARAGDFLRTDDASLRAAHLHCRQQLAKLEASGYALPRLILSFTGQWRYDNDSPFPPLAGFIDAWNRAGFQPALRFTTATQALADMEREAGAALPTREGEWTDWWANGDASGPREVAASRIAKRALAAALSPVWGPPPAEVASDADRILRDLCLFDEHTWGANSSISRPDGLFAIGQYTEKSALAYRPMAAAEWLLGRRARTRLDPLPEGLYVVNTAPAPYTGWVDFPAPALREPAAGVEDPKSGRRSELRKSPDGNLRFWLQDVPAASVLALRLTAKAEPDTAAPARPEVSLNSSGWPVSAAWPGMNKPLFAGEAGDFLATLTEPSATRSHIHAMHSTGDTARREQMRRNAFRQAAAGYGRTAFTETPHTLIYDQPLEHPRLRNSSRRMELWKHSPRARLTLRLDRISSKNPEVFYIAFGFPVPGILPQFTCGGAPFLPFTDQLEGSCRDYFAIDGWSRYATPAGEWLWVSRDAPLVSVGGPHTVERISSAPQDTHRLLSMIFDNCWHTNFVADSHGEMEFRYELLWQSRIGNPEALAASLVSDPVVLINPAARQSPELLDRLYRP